jgi:predicted membrane protein
MAAGLVRGVGFEPRARPWRVLLSGWACTVALGLLILLKLVD